MIDIHSHILPNIDDGAVTFEDSIGLVRELVDQGVTDIITTPHYIDETIYTSSRTNNKVLLEKLKAKLKAENIHVNIYLGNEIYINTNIPELISASKISTLADSKYVLVELPLSGEFPNYEDILGDLIFMGYKVILAHPERYLAIQKDPRKLDELLEMGILLQCNIDSILDRYGKRAKKIVKKLAKEKKIFTFASDLHHCHEEYRILLAKEKLKKLYSDDELKELLVTNPAKILP